MSFLNVTKFMLHFFAHQTHMNQLLIILILYPYAN